MAGGPCSRHPGCDRNAATAARTARAAPVSAICRERARIARSLRTALGMRQQNEEPRSLWPSPFRTAASAGGTGPRDDAETESVHEAVSFAAAVHCDHPIRRALPRFPRERDATPSPACVAKGERLRSCNRTRVQRDAAVTRGRLPRRTGAESRELPANQGGHPQAPMPSTAGTATNAPQPRCDTGECGHSGPATPASEPGKTPRSPTR